LRVDNFLKQSRLVKRRTLAKELCDEGAVTLNGRPVRAGKEIAPGDRLGLRLWNRRLTIEVERLPERAPSAAEARRLYRIVTESRVEEGP
jgi:ribosomal 50S subunit-recycling heat shock protein